MIEWGRPEWGKLGTNVHVASDGSWVPDKAAVPAPDLARVLSATPAFTSPESLIGTLAR